MAVVDGEQVLCMLIRPFLGAARVSEVQVSENKCAPVKDSSCTQHTEPEPRPPQQKVVRVLHVFPLLGAARMPSNGRFWRGDELEQGDCKSELTEDKRAMNRQWGSWATVGHKEGNK